MGESNEVAYFGYDQHGGDEFESSEAHDGGDDGLAGPGGAEEFHVVFNAINPGDELFDLLEEFFTDDVVRGEWEFEITEVAHVGLGPGGLESMVVSEAAEQSEETALGAAEVVHGIDAGAAEVADGLIGLVRDVDGGEFSGAQEAGEFDGVLLVGLDLITGFGGDE